ncbi:MAG: sel1 repeat family protein [Candidatus Obscuribacterales bacterium]|jgi:TPR repeat protein|nr:sel1 repeat family protein [Candidatus Obscuribacterales bacterium]
MMNSSNIWWRLLPVLFLLHGCGIDPGNTPLAEQITWDQGIVVHPELDLEWLQKQAQAGDAAAQTKLAAYYYLGTAVPKDRVMAALLFKKAAQAGVGRAQYYLGCMCLRGDGIEKNDEQGLVWLKKAAVGSQPYAGYAKKVLSRYPGSSEAAK